MDRYLRGIPLGKSCVNGPLTLCASHEYGDVSNHRKVSWDEKMGNRMCIHCDFSYARGFLLCHILQSWRIMGTLDQVIVGVQPQWNRVHDRPGSILV